MEIWPVQRLFVFTVGTCLFFLAISIIMMLNNLGFSGLMLRTWSEVPKPMQSDLFSEARNVEDFEDSIWFLISGSTPAPERKRDMNVSKTRNMKSFQRTENKMLQHSAGKTTDKDSENRKQSIQSQRNPQRYLLRIFEGRLGNVLFELASAFCIARLNNLTLIVEDVSELRHFRYKGIRVQKKSWLHLPISPVKTHSLDMCCRFDPKFMTLEPRNYSHALIGYFQSWKYFEPCKVEVKQVILFKDSIINEAIKKLADLRKRLPYRTLVGVHVRMEDFLKVAEQKRGKKVAPPDYYVRAMTYFRSNFQNVTFVVITSDPGYFKKHFGNVSDILLLTRDNSPAVDMEMLSRMDHMIITIGSFGWWIGYKNNGTVVCYKDFYVPNSFYGKQMKNNTASYLYPGWILL